MNQTALRDQWVQSVKRRISERMHVSQYRSTLAVRDRPASNNAVLAVLGLERTYLRRAGGWIYRLPDESLLIPIVDELIHSAVRSPWRLEHGALELLPDEWSAEDYDDLDAFESFYPPEYGLTAVASVLTRFGAATDVVGDTVTATFQSSSGSTACAFTLRDHHWYLTLPGHPPARLEDEMVLNLAGELLQFVSDSSLSLAEHVLQAYHVRFVK